MNEAVLQVTVRLLVGIICAAIGGFVGALVIAMIVSSTDAPDALRSFLRIGFVATTAALASRIGWFGIVETRRQTIALLVSSALAGVIGSWFALLLAGALFENTDVYILNRDISGAGFFGAVFACNIPSIIHASTLARKREI